ncbi:hypothetical protein CVT24_003888 [Panaeolus cyanescens]|uniref:tripeptidyl-peptidase II n=1 Tax=Panaeolus cyanescens TaxID=181874 RepID=A0A409VV84_9AGAR|nr:hypothetical protein CVT24_003888 [Panaeolus cyanescens]
MRLISSSTHLLALILALIIASTTALPSSEFNPTPHTYVLHEKRTSTPPGWKRIKRHTSPSPSSNPSSPPNANTQLIPLRIALTQSNLDILPDLLYDVADPESANYGKHWTPKEVMEKFKPSAESVKKVREWLIAEGLGGHGEEKVRRVNEGGSHGMGYVSGGTSKSKSDGGNVRKQGMKISPSKGWIEVHATVEQIEKLLNTEYYVFKHDNGDEHIACTEYHLPKHIAPHIDLITPSIHFDTVLRKRSSSSSSASTSQLLSAKKIGQPGHGITPRTTGTVHASELSLNDLSKCDDMITPPCLRALYGIQWYPMMSSRNTLAIVEYTPQAYVQADLDMFASNFSKHLSGKSPKLVSIDGGVVQDIQQEFSYNGESNLDLQYAMHLVNMPDFEAHQEVLLYQVGDIPQGATFNNLLDAIDGSYCTFQGGDDPFQDGSYPDDYPNGYHNPTDCGITKPANVISTSYGYNEADLSVFYTARQCAEYAKLGLMGVTVVYSSGDSGVAGNGDYCLNPDGSQTEEAHQGQGFPSTCPYITSVGATQLNSGAKLNPVTPASVGGTGTGVIDNSNDNNNLESACETAIRSGGGFSNYFAMPRYQKRHVEGYLKRWGVEIGDKDEDGVGLWNSTGMSRAYPDISANGANYMVAVNGVYHRVFGTSASAPVIASIFTLINDARLASGKKPIGFANPALYSSLFSDTTTDITSGANWGCGSEGFKAVEGWDPVTGLGTPVFGRLLAKWLLLP